MHKTEYFLKPCKCKNKNMYSCIFKFDCKSLITNHNNINEPMLVLFFQLSFLELLWVNKHC